MVMNANVVKRDLLKVMLDSVSISEYICATSLVVIVWSQTLHSFIDEVSLLTLDASLLALGFLIILFTTSQLSFQLFLHYLLKISFFISGLYMLAPIYHTLTRSISSDSILAIVIISSCMTNTGYTIKPPGAQRNPTLASNISLNSSIIASVLVASRLPSRLHVFALMLFSLQVFLFAPFVTFSIKKYSFKLHLLFSFMLIFMALSMTYAMHHIIFVLLFGLLVLISVVCPYWLIRIQEYKFEINGPWDEAKLCFDIKE